MKVLLVLVLALVAVSEAQRPMCSFFVAPDSASVVDDCFEADMSNAIMGQFGKKTAASLDISEADDVAICEVCSRERRGNVVARWRFITAQVQIERSIDFISLRAQSATTVTEVTDDDADAADDGDDADAADDGDDADAADAGGDPDSDTTGDVGSDDAAADAGGDPDSDTTGDVTDDTAAGGDPDSDTTGDVGSDDAAADAGGDPDSDTTGDVTDDTAAGGDPDGGASADSA